MEFIRGRRNLRPRHRGCVAAIGNFDGVHRGHRDLLQRLAARAQALRLPAAAILFEPQPLEHLAPRRAPARLSPLREKVEALRPLGLDLLFCLRFDARFAALSATQFIDDILVDGLGARHLTVGEDFRFGAGRAGDFDLLRRSGARLGFETGLAPTFCVDGARVSSSRIRAALERGAPEQAARLLGRPYRLGGRVARGAARGRAIGFPTANVALRHPPPLRGVFAVELHGLEEGALRGVANVGSRPTVGGGAPLLEIHLFDFDRSIYRRRVAVDFLHRLRDERRFDSLRALTDQIRRDAEQARAWFARS